MAEKQRIYDEINNFSVDLIFDAKTDVQKTVRKQMLKAKNLNPDDLVIIETQEDYLKLCGFMIEQDQEQQAKLQPGGIMDGFSKLLSGNQQVKPQINSILINAAIAHKIKISDNYEDQEVVNIAEESKSEDKEEFKEKKEPVVPDLVKKSSSLVPSEEFQNLHPRMLYEVLKHIKDHGSVDVG